MQTAAQYYIAKLYYIVAIALAAPVPIKMPSRSVHMQSIEASQGGLHVTYSFIHTAKHTHRERELCRLAALYIAMYSIGPDRKCGDVLGGDKNYMLHSDQNGLLYYVRIRL